ncbi:MAG: glycosylhydrolase-like jelly roll fold domain-containing protein, partial [Terrimicrobiaceae bacterium]
QRAVLELPGPWQVEFDPKWGGPGVVEFPRLIDWTRSEQEGIRYYSGTAVYEHPIFDLPAGTDLKDGERILLDLGDVREIAEVFVNGKSVGVAWTRPFQVDISEALKPTGNQMQIHVVNLWPNRLIYEDGLSENQRLTRTNVSKFKKEMPPTTSGLLGPVKLLKTKVSQGL